ncbi:protein transport protein Dsl1p [Monosporozyma unispora]|nr:hypothetical protein C6P44_000117 [Kazachstania unispora]
MMILELGLDRQAVLEAVSKDPILSTTQNKNDSKPVHNIDDLLRLNNDIIAQDETLTAQLEDLTKLKTFRDLVMEFNANLELYEFENCYYSLKSLRNKIKNYNLILLRQSFHFQRSLMKYIDSMHLRLIDSIYKLLFENFWIIEDNKSIKFNSTVTVDSNEINYDSFILLLDQLFFSDSVENDWFLNDMDICPEAEDARKKLFDVDSNFIKYDKLINTIKANIFNPDIKFGYDRENNLLEFNNISKDHKIESIINSFKGLIHFLENIKTNITTATATIIDPLGVIINNELLKFVRNNATLILYNNTNKTYINDIKSINDGLIKLSKDCLNWHYTSYELESLMNDKSLYYNILIDQNFNETIAEFKNLINENKNWTLQRETVTIANPTPSIKEVKSKIDSEDNWGWGEADETSKDDKHPKQEKVVVQTEDPIHEDDIENDAWNDEIDLDLDDLDETAPTNNNEGIVEATTEDHDAWDDEWDIDNDELDAAPVATEMKNQVSYTLEVTKLPEFIHYCIESFENKCSETKSLNKDYYNFKLESLQTVIFIMVQTSYAEKEWWQFYNDCKYSTAKEANLTTISSSLQQFMDGLVIRHKLLIKQTITNQLKELQRNEVNPSWSPILDTLLPHIMKELFEPLAHIQHVLQEYQYIVLEMIDFIYNKCIIDVVVKWDIISEKNSENLGELIALISQNICIDLFDQQLRQLAPTQLQQQPHLIKYKQMREKFQLIGKFLPLHMKDIMEMFYNGDFYLFPTEEIIQWITLLFADTPLRQDAITDIYEVREAANED